MDLSCIWRTAAQRTLLPRAYSRYYSQSVPPSRLAKAPRQNTHQKPAQSPLHLPSYSRSNTSESVLHVRGASSWYSPKVSETSNRQPIMGKKKNKGRVAPSKPAGSRYPLRSRNPSKKGAPFDLGQQATTTAFGTTPSSQQAQGSYQPPPQWPTMNGNVDINAFNNGLPHQTSQMFTGMNTFNMALAQPNLFSGLQSMQMPFLTPNTNMGFDASQPAFAPEQRHPLQQQVPQPAHYDTYSSQMSVAMPSSQCGVPPMAFAPLHDRPSSTAIQQVASVAPPSSNATPNHNRDRAPVTAPSEASGGIPDPSPAYTMRASFMPKRREYPGPLLVVVDLNGTVLHRPDRRNSARFLSRRYAQPFVTYCVETFWVVIWSSAKPENVKRMVDQLLTPDSLKQVVAVWGRDKFGLTDADYRARTQCYKRLTTLWNDPLIKSAYPRTRKGFEGGSWNQGNTVLIDDSTEKARSEPHNAITLPEFTGQGDEAVDVLPKVHDYLNELCYQEDVSAYMRAHPFTMS